MLFSTPSDFKRLPNRSVLLAILSTVLSSGQLPVRHSLHYKFELRHSFGTAVARKRSKPPSASSRLRCNSSASSYSRRGSSRTRLRPYCVRWGRRFLTRPASDEPPGGQFQDGVGVTAAHRRRPRHQTREARCAGGPRQAPADRSALARPAPRRRLPVLGDGMDIRIIQLMLGHASVQQTQRYLNVTDEELRRGSRSAGSGER